MSSTDPFGFIFESDENTDKEQLRQGDLLLRTPELASAIGEAHSYYAEASDYSHFLVLTQSCDLVRRGDKNCKSRYITVCAVRPLTVTVSREFESFVSPLAGCPLPLGKKENSVLARQFLERMLNNTVDGFFFIPRGTADTVDEHLCAFLPLSIALRSDHYDTCLEAKVAQAQEIFAAKVGSLASNLYSRIATPDIHEKNDKSVVRDYTQAFFEDLGYSSVIWLTTFQREQLESAIASRLAQTGADKIDQKEAQELFANLPQEADAIAARVVHLLGEKGLIENDSDVKRRASNILKNDRQYRKLTKR